MNRVLSILIGALALAFVVPAAGAGDVPAAKAAKAVASGKKSMAEKGSYHRVHATKEKLECDDCHETGPLPANTLNLRLHEPLAAGSPGPVNVDNCHECHGKPSKKGKNITWYAPKPK